MHAPYTARPNFVKPDNFSLIKDLSKHQKHEAKKEMENSLNSQLLPMSSSANLSPPWVDLPRDITAMILHKLGVTEILEVAENVCTTWRSVCRDPSIWKSIDMGNTVDDIHDSDDLDRMCRRAVDLSQGQLADITISTFCDGDLLIYISERCPRLQRLKLVYCNDLEDDSLSTALQNLPLLEELHLYYTPIYAGDVEMIGISCPLLKSFKLNHPLSMDSDAEQIFQTIPLKLRHLELIGNGISNKGLQAILDGCPDLETLDLRECYNLDFSGDIEKACSQRIKVLRHPDEALDECPFYGDRYLPSYDACSACSGDVDAVYAYESDSGGSADSYDPDDVESSTEDEDDIVDVTTALGRA